VLPFLLRERNIMLKNSVVSTVIKLLAKMLDVMNFGRKEQTKLLKEILETLKKQNNILVNLNVSASNLPHEKVDKFCVPPEIVDKINGRGKKEFIPTMEINESVSDTINNAIWITEKDLNDSSSNVEGLRSLLKPK